MQTSVCEIQQWQNNLYFIKKHTSIHTQHYYLTTTTKINYGIFKYFNGKADIIELNTKHHIIVQIHEDKEETRWFLSETRIQLRIS